MVKLGEELYNCLLEDIRHCRDKGLPFLVETECCFRIAEKYWQRLRVELMQYIFPSIEEEIHFFKMVKPKFLVESEYAMLLNYSENFCPDKKHAAALHDFWVRQKNREEKFKQKYKTFYSYYISRQVNLDVIYYTRATPGDENYAFDKTDSSYDILISQLWARERYTVYVAAQLTTCKSQE